MLSSKYPVLFFLLLSFFAASCVKTDKEFDIATEFMQARVEGNAKKAYGMLDENTKKIFSEKDFEEYCFVFKPSEFEVSGAENGYVKISYTFYDKKYKKGSSELYTFYMTDNVEMVKIQNGKIVFPHVAFLSVRKAIEAKDIDKAEYFSNIMLKLDPQNPDVLGTAEKMGFIQRQN